MGKVLITYYSQSGNTEKMAKLIEEGAMLDESVKFHGKLDGKAGGAFASSVDSPMLGLRGSA